MRQRLVVAARFHGPSLLYPPQIWRCLVTFEPEFTGEGLELEVTVAHRNASVADARGALSTVDERLRRVLAAMRRMPGAELPSADLWLVPPDGAKALAVRFVVRRTGDGKRLLARTLHVSPTI